MSTFAWSYKSNVSGNKPPKEYVGKIEQWQRKRRAENTLNEDAGSKIAPSVGKKPKPNIRARLYIGNLHWETTEVELAHYFSVFGDLEDVKVIKDHQTGNSRGFAFITFNKISEAEDARRWCAYNYPMLRGRNVIVTSAERRLPRQKKITPSSFDSSTPLSAETKDPNSTLFWEYKWTQDENAETFGPFETSVMLRWVKQGYFESGCWVRQVDFARKVDTCPTNSEHLQPERDTPQVSEDKDKTKFLIDYSDSSESEEEENSEDKVGEYRELEQGRQEGGGDGKEGVVNRECKDDRMLEKDLQGEEINDFQHDKQKIGVDKRKQMENEIKIIKEDDGNLAPQGEESCENETEDKSQFDQNIILTNEKSCVNEADEKKDIVEKEKSQYVIENEITEDFTIPEEMTGNIVECKENDKGFSKSIDRDKNDGTHQGMDEWGRDKDKETKAEDMSEVDDNEVDEDEDNAGDIYKIGTDNEQFYNLDDFVHISEINFAMFP